MRKLINIFLLVSIIYSCRNSQKGESKINETPTSRMEKFGWLLGKWENKIDEGLLIESWEIENDSVISGKSYLAKKDDTLFFESIELKIMDGNFYYVPTVKNQNDNKPVYFKLVSEVNNEFIFEDKEHDFPQRVIYNNLSKDSLSARIEGMQEGQFRKEEFAFRRSNN